MATTTGNSIIGLQRLGGFEATIEGWEVRFASAQQLDRLERVGTLLHVREISNSRYPVIRVDKLFGGGVTPPSYAILDPSTTAIWVNWFIPGLTWFFTRPDP